MTRLDFTREASAAPPLDLGAATVSRQEHQAAIETWRDRMISEHASARVFAALVAQAMRAGLPRRHVVSLNAMAAQELDHGLLCARVVEALGGRPEGELPDLPDVPAHADAPPVEALLRNVLSISCCSETVAVSLVGAEREQAGPPALRAVLESILADEVKHARFGWKLLDELAPQIDAGMRRRLGQHMVGVFRHQLAHHTPLLSLPSASDAALRLGVPDGPENWSTFLDVMDGIVVPGLEERNIPARAAWRAALCAPRPATA